MKGSDYTTHTDYTKLILNIKDNNIYFDENCLEIVNINNIKTEFFHGYLTYIPEFCPKCGCINESSNDIIKGIGRKIVKLKSLKLVVIIHYLFLINKDFFVKIVIKLLLLLLM